MNRPRSPHPKRRSVVRVTGATARCSFSSGLNDQPSDWMPTRLRVWGLPNQITDCLHDSAEGGCSQVSDTVIEDTSVLQSVNTHIHTHGYLGIVFWMTGPIEAVHLVGPATRIHKPSPSEITLLAAQNHEKFR